ncbi:hypothetical protein C8R43DRAFT_1130662 [Mycena crocata]|nr:hypothetical protein C8R43DRAFT_1130662 [Mycena crocata]
MAEDFSLPRHSLPLSPSFPFPAFHCASHLFFSASTSSPEYLIIVYSLPRIAYFYSPKPISPQPRPLPNPLPLPARPSCTPISPISQQPPRPISVALPLPFSFTFTFAFKLAESGLAEPGSGELAFPRLAVEESEDRYSRYTDDESGASAREGGNGDGRRGRDGREAPHPSPNNREAERERERARWEALYGSGLGGPAKAPQSAYTREVVYSTIPLTIGASALIGAGEGDGYEEGEEGRGEAVKAVVDEIVGSPPAPPPPLTPVPITWRAPAAEVFLIRAGDDDWRGRRAMERERNGDGFFFGWFHVEFYFSLSLSAFSFRFRFATSLSFSIAPFLFVSFFAYRVVRTSAVCLRQM